MSSKRVMAETQEPEKRTDHSRPASEAGRTRRHSVTTAESASHPVTVTAEEREQLIAIVAYFRAEQRGFGPGGELEDWLAAERGIDAALSNGRHFARRPQ